jgi:hypothetical protein
VAKVDGKMLRMWFSALLFAAVVMLAPEGARATTLNVVDGSVGQATFCSDAICLTQTLTFDDGGAASGTITVESGQVSFDVTVSVIGFSGGPDGGVSDVELQTVNYVSDPVSIVGTPTAFNSSGTAAVSGSVVPDVGLSSLIDLSAAAWTISCLDESGQLKCGLVLASPTFGVAVGGIGTRYVGHTVNLTAVPEPAVSVMGITAGLMGLAYARRRATR